MDVSSVAASGAAPDWLVVQMPPGYQTRFAEIQRLSAELSGMDRIGRLLWQCGAPLKDAVREAFASLKFDVELAPDAAANLVVRLDGKRRLLLHVSDADGALEKRSPELARVFQILHETAGGDDRVVLVTNPHPTRPPASRPDAMSADALTLVSRMGVNVLTGATLFGVWTLSLTDPARARAWVERLHGQDGGLVRPPGA
jgi:hypothetical protein